MTGTFDINLTPDKRTILLHEEQTLIKELSVTSPLFRTNDKEQLTQFYDSFQHSLPLSQFLTSTKPRRTERIKAESPDSSLEPQPLPSSSNEDPAEQDVPEFSRTTNSASLSNHRSILRRKISQ